MVDDPAPVTAWPTRSRRLSPALARRGLLLSCAAALAAPVARGQVTDLRGFDPLWRDAEAAIRAFFGPVAFARGGLELDLPDQTDSGGTVPLTLRVDAAMTAADHPVVVHVLAHGNPTPHVFSAWFTPANGRGEVSTRIRLERSQMVTAVARMSDGRHLRADRSIAVAVGACAQIGEGSNDEVVAFQPRSRVSVPARARRGDIVPVRALISHPMETGLRSGSADEWIRQRILSRFVCAFDGAELFRARLYPAIATNPYLHFHARAAASGTFEFDWYDTLDLTFTNRATMIVE
jgi:predicted secreted protein